MFISARIKLTAWNLLIIMFISLFFSLVIYRVLTQEFERFERQHRFRIERQFNQDYFPPPGFRQRFTLRLDPELIKETKNRLKFMLIIINSGILVISRGLAYFLAGRTLRPIKDMVEEQNRFISDASHELRTPLTSLKTAMEVSLRDKNLSLMQAKKLISENVDEVNKLQSLSDQLLRLAQFEKPKGNLIFEKINLHQVVQTAVNKIRPIAKIKNISIKTKFQDRNIDISGHKESLVDLFVILLDNAVKYSPRASGVEIKTWSNDGSAQASVTDKGIGISKQDLPLIFDRFYRAETARSKNRAYGYGLGLSIAKKIINLHKGIINVKSEDKTGTIFTVQLPRIKK